MPNMGDFIKMHSMNISKGNNETNPNLYSNCTRMECPMPNAIAPNNCEAKDIIYLVRAHNDGTNTVKNYIGNTSTELKVRVSNHRNNFVDPTTRSYWELSKEIHRLRNSGQTYNVTWEIIGKEKSFAPGDRYCR